MSTLCTLISGMTGSQEALIWGLLICFIGMSIALLTYKL